MSCYVCSTTSTWRPPALLSHSLMQWLVQRRYNASSIYLSHKSCFQSHLGVFDIYHCYCRSWLMIQEYRSWSSLQLESNDTFGPNHIPRSFWKLYSQGIGYSSPCHISDIFILWCWRDTHLVAYGGQCEVLGGLQTQEISWGSNSSLGICHETRRFTI